MLNTLVNNFEQSLRALPTEWAPNKWELEKVTESKKALKKAIHEMKENVKYDIMALPVSNLDGQDFVSRASLVELLKE